MELLTTAKMEDVKAFAMSGESECCKGTNRPLVTTFWEWIGAKASHSLIVTHFIKGIIAPLSKTLIDKCVR
jgi:hypothetical protein